MKVIFYGTELLFNNMKKAHIDSTMLGGNSAFDNRVFGLIPFSKMRRINGSERREKLINLIPIRKL